ncbi:MAG: hypothetical protein PVH74_14915 [Desulfobacterales bacterium]
MEVRGCGRGNHFSVSSNFKETNNELTAIQATHFLAGLYEDTGNLTSHPTTAKDALTVVYLLAQAADLSVLSTFLRPTYGEHHIKILVRMLQSAKKEYISSCKISIKKLNIKRKNQAIKGLSNETSFECYNHLIFYSDLFR